MINQIINDSYLELLNHLNRTVLENKQQIFDISNLIIESIENNGKIIFFGNGGSAADSQHLAAELVNRFKINRKPLPSIALTTDSSILTSIGNDFSFDEVFEKQVESLVNENDVVIGISTSGKSNNVLFGLLKAKEIGAKTILLTSEKIPSEIENFHKNNFNVIFKVKGTDTPRIQEVHIFIGHIICEIVEKHFFGR